jgi:hypothetical protein
MFQNVHIIISLNASVRRIWIIELDMHLPVNIQEVLACTK